ncbi:MAG: hypothetical protein IJI21_09035 [Clostridia bacterium]|nr:hypothetical protein [Clostridia bacterium]
MKKTYEELVREYRKRQRDTVVDTLASGLTYLDEIAVDAGLLEETGLWTELTENLTGLLPFAIISVSEGSKVLLGKKPGKTGLKDGAFRIAKTGAALGVGAAVSGLTGFWAAIPATMGVRALFDRYKSRALTGRRVQGRINRLKELNRFIRQEEEEKREPLTEGIGGAALAAEGGVE